MSHAEFVFENRVIYETVTRIRVVHVEYLKTFVAEAFEVGTAYLDVMSNVDRATR